MKLKDKVVFITGASRGIGKACALACAREGAHIVAAAKSDTPHPKLPGTIGETVREVESLRRRGLAIRLDVRDADACEAAIEQTVREMGSVDIVINNAGALWWADVLDTPVNKFDLIMGVNVRAAFVLSRAALPHMIERKYGHVLMMSPPYELDALPHHGAYAVSKLGMTMIAQAIAGEYAEHNIAAHALWPATAIRTAATEVFKLGTPQMWREPDIMADATVGLLSKDPAEESGNAWLDEDFLRAEGVTDFSKYRCDPNSEPPKLVLKDIPPISGAMG